MAKPGLTIKYKPIVWTWTYYIYIYIYVQMWKDQSEVENADFWSTALSPALKHLSPTCGETQRVAEDRDGCDLAGQQPPDEVNNIMLLLLHIHWPTASRAPTLKWVSVPCLWESHISRRPFLSCRCFAPLLVKRHLHHPNVRLDGR